MSQRYEVQGKIGQGGLGEVYLARDTQLDREVALKRVRAPEDADMTQLEQDLIREAKTLSALQHPNIVTIYDVGRDEKGPYVVMELLKGETLDQVADRGKLSVEDFTEVALQVLEGMVAAQNRGLVHRDLKPGNLMVNWLASGKFQVKILDFGLARFTRQAKPQTADQEDGIFGSIYFMAPEQFERLPLDGRTDMYSLGCIFYQVLTQQHPFDGETAVDVMVSHLQHLVTPLQELRKDAPRWMCDWVMWLLSREMEDRPADARTALEAFVAKRLPHALPETAPTAGHTTVKVVGRGRGPGSQATAGPATARPGGRTTQALSGGTSHSARSSRPAVKKVTKKRGGSGPVMLAALALVIGGVGWYKFMGPGSRAKQQVESPAQLLDRLTRNPRPEGTADTVRELLALSAGGERAAEVGGVLKSLTGPGVPEALAAGLAEASGPNRLSLIDAIQERPTPAGMEALALAAGKDTGEVLARGLKALARHGDAAQAGALLGHAAKTTADQDRERIMATVASLMAKAGDGKSRIALLAPALKDAPAAGRAGILQLLSGIDDAAANDVLLEEITAGGARRQAALEALPGWAAADRKLAGELNKLAEKADKDLLGPHCIRLAAQDRHADAAETVTLLKAVAPLATGSKAKEALETALGSLGSAPALEYARQIKAEKAVQRITQHQAQATVMGKTETILPGKSVVILSSGKDAYYSDTTRYIGGWKDRSTRLAWDVTVDAKADVEVEIQQSLSDKEPRTVRVTLGPDSRIIPAQTTPGSEDFTVVSAGSFSLPRAGSWRLWVEAVEAPPGATIMNIRSVSLRRK